MQINKSAEKRNRQNETLRVHNKAYRSETRTLIRKIRESAAEKNKADAEKMYKDLVRLIDKCVNKGLFHKNTAARKKSRLYRFVQAIATA